MSEAPPRSQGAPSTLGPEEYLELAQGESTGVQWGDPLRQVPLFLCLLVHNLLIPLLLGLGQHQTL